MANISPRWIFALCRVVSVAFRHLAQMSDCAEIENFENLENHLENFRLPQLARQKSCGAKNVLQTSIY